MMDKELTREWEETWEEHADRLAITRTVGFFNGDTPVKLEQDIRTEEVVKRLMKSDPMKSLVRTLLREAYQAGMTDIGRKCLGAVEEKDEPPFYGYQGIIGGMNPSPKYVGEVHGWNKARTAILTILQDNGVEIKSA